DGELASPTTWNDQAIVVDAFSKSHALTGWRLGSVHGPSAVIEKMTMLQQYTFVCAPHPLQWGAVAAADTDVSAQMAEYRERRDRVVAGLREAGYKTATPGGAFYVFPEVPPAYESGAEFAAKAVEHEMLVIPGGIFSDRDTHFRISFAASMETIDRGLEVLRAMAR
ncbi:MAG: aminotransferase class I/II-fold pyridoxal phosphate-dependent enzyme, partial [Planctomycetota bacterium]